MALAGLVFLVASLSSVQHGDSSRPASIERIVVVLGQKDPVTSSRVLERMKSCTDSIPTAVVSAFGEFRVVQDFTSDRPGPGAGAFSLAAQLPPERIDGARSFATSLQILAEALASVGPTTAIVLVSPQVSADRGTGVQWSGGLSPANRSIEGEKVSATVLGHATVSIPQPVLEARKALRQAGLTVVAVNTSGAYDAGAKALTEMPRGRYLHASQRKFPEALVSAVCAPGR